MEELRECPFCGGKAQQSYAGAKHIIICPNCVKLPADGGYIDSKDAVTAWNTRLDNWISVEERLPETNEDVLVVVDYGGKSGVITGYMRSQNLGWQGLVGQRLTDVTHWMPLPEPPKGVE